MSYCMLMCLSCRCHCRRCLACRRSLCVVVVAEMSRSGYKQTFFMNDGKHAVRDRSRAAQQNKSAIVFGMRASGIPKASGYAETFVEHSLAAGKDGGAPDHSVIGTRGTTAAPSFNWNYVSSVHFSNYARPTDPNARALKGRDVPVGRSKANAAAAAAAAVAASAAGDGTTAAAVAAEEAMLKGLTETREQQYRSAAIGSEERLKLLAEQARVTAFNRDHSKSSTLKLGREETELSSSHPHSKYYVDLNRKMLGEAGARVPETAAGKGTGEGAAVGATAQLAKRVNYTLVSNLHFGPGPRPGEKPTTEYRAHHTETANAAAAAAAAAVVRAHGADTGVAEEAVGGGGDGAAGQSSAPSAATAPVVNANGEPIRSIGPAGMKQSVAERYLSKSIHLGDYRAPAAETAGIVGGHFISANPYSSHFAHPMDGPEYINAAPKPGPSSPSSRLL
jgi:hypothetical protein